jgi:hypothetical protein
LAWNSEPKDKFTTQAFSTRSSERNFEKKFSRFSEFRSVNFLKGRLFKGDCLRLRDCADSRSQSNPLGIANLVWLDINSFELHSNKITSPKMKSNPTISNQPKEQSDEGGLLKYLHHVILTKELYN